MLMLEIDGSPVCHTCLGILRVRPKGMWVTVSRGGDLWTQDIEFNPLAAKALKIEIGTFRTTVHVTMPQKEVDDEEKQQQTGTPTPAIVPSSSGA
jgi:hypothetical protein